MTPRKQKTIYEFQKGRGHFLHRFSIDAFRGQDPELIKAVEKKDPRVGVIVDDDIYFQEIGKNYHLIRKARLYWKEGKS
jgi:hypothetical protein